MRQAFPEIIREYLEHYSDTGITRVPSPSDRVILGPEGTIQGFQDILYSRAEEKNWEDAYFHRVLLMMVYAARAGSQYSRNVLLALYKVYYKPEYDRLKRLSKLTYLDVLEMHDEACRRQGLPSGHSTQGGKTYQEAMTEKRMHEPGGTNVYGKRDLFPAVAGGPLAKMKDGEYQEQLSSHARMHACPDEPPLDPNASRLMIMAEMMGIEIEPLLAPLSQTLNSTTDFLLRSFALADPFSKKAWDFWTAEYLRKLRTLLPEMFDPCLYQKDENYLALEIAETVLEDMCKRYGVYYRYLYNCKEFSLPDLMAGVLLSTGAHFRDLELDFDVLLVLCMLEYVIQALFELNGVREQELEHLLRFRHRQGSTEGDYAPEEKKEAAASHLTDKVLHSVKNLSPASPGPAPVPEEEPVLDLEQLREENRRLKELLAQKEEALAEAQQKVIRQRVLYEKARERSEELEELTGEQAVEHTELIALRQYVYEHTGEEEDGIDELDDPTREQMLEDIRDKKVAVLGGTPKWVKRMKRLLPSWSFVSVEGTLGDMLALERADYIYIYTSALKHTQYYQAMNLVEKQKKVHFYLSGTNLSQNLRQFHQDLCG